MKSAWLIRPEKLRYDGVPYYGSENQFLKTLLLAFDDLNDAAVLIGRTINWNEIIAERFANAIFGTSKRISTKDARERIKMLALTREFEYDFCRRAAYYLNCLELAQESMRTAGAAQPIHFWNDPEKDIPAWSKGETLV
jgi:hypothetical protein